MYGKLIGAIVGGSVGMLLELSPMLAGLLAVLGLVVGHFLLDREPDQPRVFRAEWPETPRRRVPPVADRDPSEARRAPAPAPIDHAWIDALSPLFIELARVDGMVSRPEVRVIREFFEVQCKLDAPSMEAVRLALKKALESPVQDLAAVVGRARAEVKPWARVEVMRWLYDMALTDGALTNTETNALKRIVQDFELSEEQLQQVTTQFFGTGAEHFECLGLTVAATDDEVRSAYRRLAAENHPDRAASLGAAEVTIASERFRQIKEAYEALKRIRGL